MWFMLVMRWLVLALFVWFMFYEVLVPLWNKQPLFPAIREFFRDKQEPAKADSKQPAAKAAKRKKRGNDE